MAEGIRSTASVVTSAAVVMVAVFAIFGTLTFVDMKQMGVGNWYLPHALRARLPQPARATA